MGRVLALIPVFNHARTLRAVTEGCLRQGLPVLVVDDGSTDPGLEAVAGLPVQCLRLDRNRGKGAAILAGAAWARAEGFQAILTLDADGQHDPADAPRLLEAGRERWPAIVVGARRMETDHVPFSSRFGRAFSNFWVRLECGRSLSDTQSGYRLYPLEHLVGGRFLTRRYTFEVEVLVRGAWAGLELLSTPVGVYYPPGGQRVSHFRKFRDNLRLSLLHSWLTCRSLLPWPHRRLFTPRAPEQEGISLWRPLAFFRRLSQEHTGAGELAAAAALGIFLGALPIIPFGIAAILYASHRLKLNKLAAVGASNLCCAPFVPFLCIQAGHLLLHGRLWTDFHRQALLHQIHLRLGEWLLGSLLLGPALGGLGATFTYALVRLLRRPRTGTQQRPSPR
jgi:glycosyltransferase involved in cell wall biosynthesis